MSGLFYPILALHLIAVVIKLGILVYIPFLKSVAQIQTFLGRYRKIDRVANYLLWGTGIGMVLATSLRLLLQLWLDVSMLIYILIFLMIKRVVVRRMEKIVESNKVYARDEIKTLRFENYCTIIAAVILFLCIGGLMMMQPTL